jgi:hypothetical protein
MGVPGNSRLNPSAVYYLNNFASGDPLYVGKVSDVNRVWLIQRFSTTTGVMGYANALNNPTYTNYATAWTNRATLTYSPFEVMEGI